MSKEVLIKKYQQEYAYDKALHFDGSNDYISLPNLGFNGNADITIECLVKIDTLGADRSFIFFGNEVNAQTAQLKVNIDNTVRFGIFGEWKLC